ncbi:MAG: hypothetical protein KDD42_04890 [Bdellovibrionales bacterium]|nr:hypothetical protein [Bdellovibrionales bacterium]
MATLASNIKLSSFSRSSVLTTGLVILLVIALFFIPEILDFRKSLGGDRSDMEIGSSVIDADNDEFEFSGRQKLESASVQDRTSPLTRLADALEQGRYNPEVQLDDSDNMRARADLVDQSQNAGYLYQEPLTWKQIKQRRSSDSLKDARKQALDIAKKLNDANSDTRYALYSLANGIRQVLQSSGDSMRDDEAVSYLAHLDRTVTSTMIREGID